jgi:hypothetical protein
MQCAHKPHYVKKIDVNAEVYTVEANAQAPAIALPSGGCSLDK